MKRWRARTIGNAPDRRRVGARSWSRPWFAGFLLLTISLPGCAYFNTFYNARKIYREAEKSSEGTEGRAARNVSASYDRVIKKCESLIADHSGSKWVDDALLLMGKAYYGKEAYDEAINRFDELEANFPKSSLIEESRLFMAKSYLGKGQTEQAVPILKAAIERRPDGDFSDEILFLLGTNLIKLGEEGAALAYLEVLNDEFPKSLFRLEADLKIADLYMEREEYAKGFAALNGLATVRLDEEMEIRYLTKRSEILVKMGRYSEALAVFEEVKGLVLTDVEMADQLLLEADAYVGMDSISAALDKYKSVTASYPRSKFSAEAAFRMGVLYQESLDSLRLAKEKFDLVPRQYAKSPFAPEAIQRSVSITRLQRLRASLGKESGEGRAAVQFDLAEVQLFQFQDFAEAVAGYRTVLDSFPESDVAAKAAFAIGYVYETFLHDTTQAIAAYEYLLGRYPDSQQARQARQILEKIGRGVQDDAGGS